MMSSELLYPKLFSFNRNSYHSWLIRPLTFLFYACLISTFSLYFSKRKEYFYRLIPHRYFIVNSVPLRPLWVQFILAPSHPLECSPASLSLSMRLSVRSHLPPPALQFGFTPSKQQALLVAVVPQQRLPSREGTDLLLGNEYNVGHCKVNLSNLFLFCSSFLLKWVSIIKVLERTQKKWDEALLNTKSGYKIVFGKSKAKRPSGRSGSSWKEVRIIIKEILLMV